MVYQYVAYNEGGQLVRGKLPAVSEEAANELLDYAGYQVVSLKEHIPFISLDKLSATMGQVKPAEVILFCRQLAMLLESGTDIAASLELLQQQADNRVLRRVLGEVLAEVRGGRQLSTALVKYPKIFPQMYSQLIGIGEQSGELDKVLRQVAEYMEKEVATSKETKNALRYPAITFVVAIIVIGILVTFVLPTFGKLYDSLGVELPSLVRMLMGISTLVKEHGIYILLGVVVIAGLVVFYAKTPRGRYLRDALTLKLPRFGRVKHLSELARCCRNISFLFHAGLPLTDVMPLIVQNSGNKVIAKALFEAEQGMIKGEGLSQPLAKNKIFLPTMVQMVRVGEETGNLDVTLLSVAQSYEAEAEDKLRSIITLIQPTMTLFLGLIIGLIALSLTEAMYSLYGSL